MVKEYGENDDAPDGVTKWPFYFSAFFILALVLGFAYLHLEENQTLDQWQLTTCILASALASILVFIPHLLDRFLYLVFDPANRKDEELHRKTYFDIKEMRGDLETLAVKIDKVPSLVDKILTEALSKEQEAGKGLAKLSEDLEEAKEELLLKISGLQELTEQSPLLPEPDPGIAQANESIAQLEASIKSLASQLQNLQETVVQIPTEFPQPETSPLPQAQIQEYAEEEDEGETDSQPEGEEETTKEISQETEPDSDEVTETAEAELESVPDEPIKDEAIDSETDEVIERENERTIPEEGEVEPEAISENEVIEAAGSENPSADIKEADSSVSVETNDPQTEELNLDLPDPEETLRKVDALLSGEEPQPEAVKKEVKPKASSGGATSVIANVMIGIGNKPFLRGEGTGLSWDEGVPMNFIEIGKWAWTPPRKNASLTVQVYRNDEDPDKGGKIEVKSGEEIEITPDFS